MSEPDLNELRQNRPGDRASNTSDTPDLQDHFISALDEVEGGGSNKKTVSAREEDLAAFVRGLEADEDELENVVTRLQDARGKGDGVNRQELIIAAAWVGIKSECGDVVEEFKDAKMERIDV